MIIINKPLLANIRLPGICDYCGKMASVRQPHHLRCRGMGGRARLDIPINLAALHPKCHKEVQGQSYRERVILWKVAARELYAAYHIKQVVNHLLRLPKETTEDELEELGLLQWVAWKPPVIAGDEIPLPF